MEVISNHKTEMKVMISKHNTGSVKYCVIKSKISLLPCWALMFQLKPFLKLRKQNMFSLLFDCIPDAAIKNRRVEKIQYINVTDEGSVFIQFFVVFILLHDYNMFYIVHEV
jgi:hypothetical protein